MLWFWLLAVPMAVAFGVGSLAGAPYLPILRRQSEPLLDLVQLEAGQTIVDLGCGDGRLLRLAAQRGVRGIGYEINPILWLIATMSTWRYRHLVSIRMGDYWRVKLPEADVIYVFLIEHYMQKLERKLQTEVSQPTLIVSYVFALPTVSPLRQSRNAFVYRLPQHAKTR